MYSVKNFKKDVDLIEIYNGLNLKATLCNFGAGMYSLYFNEDPMILELDTVENYMHSRGYFNKTLGSVAGRIPCIGSINNKTYNLDPVEEGKDFDLHGGGIKSLSFKPWKYEIKENDMEIRVIFKIKTKNLENGFIGRASIKVIYVFSKIKNDFKILFKAKALDDTLLNLSNHIYWSFARDLSLEQYKLKFNADRVALMRDDLLFFGVDDVPNYIDFRNARKIKGSNDFIRKNVSVGTIDNTFLFDSKIGKAILKSDKYELKMKTNYPAMNIYLDNSLSDAKFNNRSDYGLMRGIALEPQLFVLDHNQITFYKGDIYDYKIEYSLKLLEK